MFRTLIRKLDMGLGLTTRGKLAASIATSTGMDASLAYQGAVYITLADWLPELWSGLPLAATDPATEFHVVQSCDGDANLRGFSARFDPDANAWLDVAGIRVASRSPTDRWIPAGDHNEAMRRAAQRAKARVASGLTVRNLLSLMWRYQKSTTIMLGVGLLAVAIGALHLCFEGVAAWFGPQAAAPVGFGVDVAMVAGGAIAMVVLAQAVLDMSVNAAAARLRLADTAPDVT